MQDSIIKENLTRKISIFCLAFLERGSWATWALMLILKCERLKGLKTSWYSTQK